jgi:hypothetical protein
VRIVPTVTAEDSPAPLVRGEECQHDGERLVDGETVMPEWLATSIIVAAAVLAVFYFWGQAAETLGWF